MPPPFFPLATLTIALLLAWVGPAKAGMKIYYLRHAEGGHNVVEQWKDKPRETWPEYVGKSDMFTPLGEKQVAAVADKLRAYHFDFIAVSPIWRTRHTILPYLAATNQHAEIWPELAEFKGPGKLPLAGDLPAASVSLFTGGSSIALPEAERAAFTLRPDALTEMKLGNEDSQLEADRRAVAAKIVAMLAARFGGTDKSILLVGHGNSGRYLANYLIKSESMEVKHPANTGLWMAEQQPDGTFRLRLFNDKPWMPQAPATAVVPASTSPAVPVGAVR